MQTKVKENIHSGHRQRLMELAYRSGFENLTNIQAVELILCYVFPRGDVNPLAHRLIDRYKNLATIMEAPIEDLKMVKGMGYTSALKLHNLLGIYNGYFFEKVAKKEKLVTRGDVYDYIESLLRFKTVEEVHLIGLNANGELIGERCIARGNINLVGIDMRDISLFVATYNVPNIIIVHNHVDADCIKSPQDADTHKKINGKFKFAGCKLLDNLVIGRDGIYSLKKKKMLRIFVNSPNYFEALNQLNKISE